MSDRVLGCVVDVASKHGIAGWAGSLFLAVQDKGIKITTINPGYVHLSEPFLFFASDLDRILTIFPVSDLLTRPRSRRASSTPRNAYCMPSTSLMSHTSLLPFPMAVFPLTSLSIPSSRRRLSPRALSPTKRLPSARFPLAVLPGHLLSIYCSITHRNSISLVVD